jgi:hypothetical protein
MSKSFLYRFIKEFKIPKKVPLEIGIPFLGLVTCGHLCYAIGTKEEKEIIVSKK